MKIDLHRHLEGSHSAEALAAVAATFDVRDPLFFDPAARRHRTAAELASSLVIAEPTDDGLVLYRCIQRARAAYVSEAAIGELARRAFIEAAADTDGFEMRASLFSMTRTLLENERVAWRELEPRAFADRAERVLEGILAARDVAARESGVPMLLRIGFSRTFESEPHYRAFADMLRAHRKQLSGLDVLGVLTGTDKEPMPEGLRRILLGLRPDFPDLTVHAGEFEDHRSVLRTLELEPQGIGHGVHSAGDDEVMAELSRRQVTLEVCPHSNHLLIPTALMRLRESRGGTHPLPVLQAHGVRCVLGSDDPVPMGTCFSEEWRRAAELGADLGLLERDIALRWQQLGGKPIRA